MSHHRFGRILWIFKWQTSTRTLKLKIFKVGAQQNAGGWDWRFTITLELLQKNGLPHSGKKEELIDRLVKHDERKALEINSLEEEFGNLEDFDESKLDLE